MDSPQPDHDHNDAVVEEDDVYGGHQVDYDDHDDFRSCDWWMMMVTMTPTVHK